jgi:hypothetical protein
MSGSSEIPQPETATKPPSRVTAEELRSTLEDTYAAPEAVAVSPEVAVAPGSVTAPEPLAPLPGRFEAGGAAAGSKVDALVDRGSSAVAAGKEKIGEKVDGAALKAYELAGKVDGGIERGKEAYRGAKERLRAKVEHVRERVRGGAELAAEKRAAAVSLTKEKSKEALLAAIGASIVAGEKIAETPENIKNRGRKIADKLNKWCAKAKELFSGMKDNVKDRVTEGIGKVVVETVVRIDAAGKNWEARLQEARKEAEVAAEKARKESLIKSYIEASILAAQEQADTEHAAAVKRADEEREVKVGEADAKRDQVVNEARKNAEGEVAALSADDIELKIKGLGQAAPETGATVEKSTEVVPDASESVPLRPATPDSAPPAPELAAA